MFTAALWGFVTFDMASNTKTAWNPLIVLLLIVTVALTIMMLGLAEKRKKPNRTG